MLLHKDELLFAGILSRNLSSSSNYCKSAGLQWSEKPSESSGCQPLCSTMLQRTAGRIENDDDGDDVMH